MIKLFLSTALITIIFSQGAQAKTYECDAVESIAMLGISPRSPVSISADEDEDECKFSVNGAKVGSPPQEQISDAFNRLLFQDRLLFSGQFDATALAAMMLAAGPDDSTDEVSSLLSDAETEISGCISDLEMRAPGSFNDLFVQEFSSFDSSGLCVVLDSEGFEFEAISFRYDEGDNIPVLLIFLKRGSVTNLLAIPRPPQ
ncbi:hypothetical protein ROA7450_01525 [Roseovarius albus]|uniref:Uncharacterized protein n=1 Tax=Roseovarius albus TaxID=1247867 RepID=A0A1X6YXQ5_9RHOB|nr:hypothetical protein [Roseovarius albus]SLN34233.1 hypothetical protein ROA7450_01525 [Roseovarius albus]